MCPHNYLPKGLKWGIISAALCLSQLLTSGNVLAKSQSSSAATHDYLRLNVGLAIAHGGDDVVDITFSDGTQGKISAGSGASLYVGLFIDSYESVCDIAINVGLMDESDTATEGKAELRRIFIDSLMLFTPHRHHRLGIGVSGHLLTKLNAYNENIQIQSSYSAALGYLLQYEYLFSSKGRGIPSIGIRYLDISYNNKDSREANIDASHIALSLNYIF